MGGGGGWVSGNIRSCQLWVLGSRYKVPGRFPHLSKIPFFREFGGGWVGVRPLAGPPPPFQFPDNQNPPASIHFPGFAKKRMPDPPTLSLAQTLSTVQIWPDSQRDSRSTKGHCTQKCYFCCVGLERHVLAQFGDSASFWGQIIFFEPNPSSWLKFFRPSNPAGLAETRFWTGKEF